MLKSDKTYSYGKQSLDFKDYWGVLSTLKSPFLTCGPKVKEFEQAICDYTRAKYCVSVSNATAGLHLAMLALGVGQGDEVITSPMTFLASANCALYAAGTVKFADIELETANIDPKEIEKQITDKTKAIIPVHFAGQSCDMEKIKKIAEANNLFVVEDAAHAIGSDYKDTKVGSCKYSDMTVFSFHPVKTITTGEGGAITTNNKELYEKLLALRSHGMHKDGEMTTNWKYEMRELGFNYRMTDIQAALGVSQLKKLDKFKQRRREIVEYYNENLGLPHLIEKDFSNACFHLYPVMIRDRENFYNKAKSVGLNLQVHYIPVHTQPYYKNLGFKEGDFPNAEIYYKKCISLPLYPDLTDCDLKEIVKRIKGHIMKLGLKLWSVNTDFYLEEAKKLYKEGWFDYIELYVVPNTLNTLGKWKTLQTESDIPFTLHAPHFMHEINLAKPEYEKFNIEIFKEVNKFSSELNAEYVVVHSGIEGSIEETIRQLKLINLPKLLIENKPYIAPLGAPLLCRGATIEEITKVISEVGCGFCLDIGHSLCTANSLKINPYEYMTEFNSINPTCYHFSDNFIDSHIDKHLHFGQGNYDFEKILAIINVNQNIAIETNKNNKKNLNDFVEDIKFIKEVEYFGNE